MIGLPERASLQDIAEALRTSPRTLQRRLRGEGTSHGELLQRVRMELAAESLERGVAVGEIAWRLGYATPSSFHRAYRAWFGTTPAAGS